MTTLDLQAELLHRGEFVWHSRSMHIKPDDVLVVHLVVVGNIGALEVKKGLRACTDKFPNAEASSVVETASFFLAGAVAVMGAAEGTRDFLCTGFGVGIVAASIAIS